MELEREIELAKKAVEKGFLKQEQLEEAVELTFALRKAGSSRGLMDVLIGKRYLSFEHANRLYEEAGLPIRLCPSCGADFSVEDPALSRVCWRCGESIEQLIPSEVLQQLDDAEPIAEASGPVYLIEVSSPERRKHPLGSSPVSIGRNRENTIVVRDMAASKKHARITKAPEGYVLWDLQSRNGTKVNGEDVSRTVLRRGDVIDIGQTRFLFVDERKKAPEAQKESPEHTFTLTCIRGLQKGESYIGGKDPVLIGKSRSCDLVLAEPETADFQTQISFTSSGVQVFHVGGRVPTILNGRMISAATPKSGDILRIGNALFRIIVHQFPEEAATQIQPVPAIDSQPVAPSTPRPAARPRLEPSVAADQQAGELAEFDEHVPSASISSPVTKSGRAEQVNAPAEADSMIELVCTSGPDRGLSISVSSKPLTIGRGPTADIRTSDLACSREHALVQLGPDGPEIRDLGSRNGTYVNGKRIKYAKLRIGDEVRIGKDVFLVDLAIGE